MSPAFINQVAETITTIIAFVIFFWIMKKFAWGPVTQVVDERQRRIEQGFEDIKRKQADAEALHKQYEARLRDIEQEARTKIQEGVAEGRRLRAELAEQGREEAAKIVERAQRNIELEVAKARHELRDEIVAMTLQATEKVLRRTVDEAEQRRLVGAFIEDLDRQSKS